MNLASYLPGKDGPPCFQPAQVVYLSHANLRLYAEVVQFVEARQLYWVRPLALVSPIDPEEVPWFDCDRLTIHDLRDGADLMCPAVLFEAAIDTDVLPLLAWLYQHEVDATQPTESAAPQRLHQFVRSLWQAHPRVFAARSE